MELTVQNVYGLLLRSKLLSFEDAKAMMARWNEDSKDQAGNLAKFAAWMVANKYVTEYQAQLLARGHADGFFLNDYKILERLGKGQMAGVYKAQYKLGQIVAIKVLPPSRAKDATMLARFKREAKLATRLRHPNIVRSFQVGQSGTLHYLVMEYLVGETVEEMLARRKQLPPAEAAQLVFQALQGLEHIHEKGLVHRDLKPSNLMLTPPSGSTTLGSSVKILDIGLGRVMEDSDDTDAGLTGEGVLLGTPDYMAPEQARDPRSIDIRSDIYALGCVLYHLLSGQPPFPDTNIISQMIRHANETPRPLVEFNKTIPDGLQQIVNWMMAKTPEGRYPIPARAASALEVFLTANLPPSSIPDMDPAMASYINELEREEAKAPPSGAAISTSQIPAVNTFVTPVKRSSEKKSLEQTKEEGQAKRDKRASAEERRKKSAPDSPSGDSATDGGGKAGGASGPSQQNRGNRRAKIRSARMIEVEPVVMPEAVAKPEEDLYGPVTRRDFVVFFAGVGLVIIAYLLGQGLAYLLFRRGREPEKTPEGDG
ncbi:MAG: serine/threonine protein kinase [Planctomycetia bacterium]|nr:serine/threonine protein kinase [Planctomycetia bacterium]